MADEPDIPDAAQGYQRRGEPPALRSPQDWAGLPFVDDDPRTFAERMADAGLDPDFLETEAGPSQGSSGVPPGRAEAGGGIPTPLRAAESPVDAEEEP